MTIYKFLNLTSIQYQIKGEQIIPPGYGTLKTYKRCINLIIPIVSQLSQTMHKMAWKGEIILPSTKPLRKRKTTQKLTNSIKPYKMDTNYIRHTNNFHIDVGMKLQSQSIQKRC